MFYLGNVQNWLGEVITSCNEEKLDPEQSIFCLMLFSSLDFECVEFFRKRKNQISSYSGDNVHIFTPIIFADDVIPDGEWRYLRDDFQKSGIRIGSGPSAVFFRLLAHGKSFEPDFFSAHDLPPSIPLAGLLRDIVDACARHRQDPGRLTTELSRITQSPNVARLHGHPEFSNSVRSALDQPHIFLSHSTYDKPLVRKLCDSLKAHYMNPWFDEAELALGDELIPAVEAALRRSDVLLLFLSEHSAHSRWVQHEAAFFSGAIKDGRIIPVVLDDQGLKLAQQLPSTQGLLYLDLRDSSTWDKNIKHILDAARKQHRA